MKFPYAENEPRATLYTPAEVRDLKIGRTEHPFSNKISEKLFGVIQVHPLFMRKDVMEVCEELCKELLRHYDSVSGVTIPMAGLYPKDYTRGKTFDLYVVDIMTVLGWIIDETNKEKLVFKPDQALTPSDVQFEIEKRVAKQVGQAVEVINDGLLHYKSTFTSLELHLDQKMNHDTYLVIRRLKEKYQGYSIQVSGQVSEPETLKLTLITPT